MCGPLGAAVGDVVGRINVSSRRQLGVFWLKSGYLRLESFTTRVIRRLRREIDDQTHSDTHF